MKQTLYLTLLLLASTQLFAFIVPPLEREINITLNNETVKSALSKIQDQTGLVFSYRHDIVDNLGPITLQIKQKTVREALALMLPKNIFYKQKSNYIILKEKPIEKNPKKLELSGYVIDRNTEKKLANVTIYDKTTLKAVTTDEYGYYTIKVPNDNQCIKVNKENYRDTCISLNTDKAITNISIDPLNETVLAKDSANWRRYLRSFSNSTNELFRKFKGYINTRNVKDSLSRTFQVSLFPFVGTNGLLSGNVYNKYSFNVVGGYSRGTNLFELGGVFNINKEKMFGAQVAGAFNVVGDTATGLQVAGLLNVTGKEMTGIQVAGLMNLNLGSMRGVQAAGAINVNVGNMRGVMVSGIANYVHGSAQGVLWSNAINVVADTLNGLSVAGILNVTNHSNQSLEMASIFNHAQKAKNNTQIASLVNNTAKGSSRFQLAILLNMTDKLTGAQIAFLNYADTASGIPFGFLSIVKHGLHQVEIGSDELFPINIGLRTGVHKFYNAFNFGIKRKSGNSLWSIGYGAGTSIKLKKKLRTDFTFTANHVSFGELYYATSELYRFYWGLEYKVVNKFALAVGPTFNLYWSDALLPDYKTVYSTIAPYYSYNYNLANDFNLKGWYGFRATLRFL